MTTASTSTPDTTTPSMWRQPRAVWAVAFACVIAFMGIGLVDPILKPIAEQLHASPSQVSLLFTSYMAVIGVAMPSPRAASNRMTDCATEPREDTRSSRARSR